MALDDGTTLPYDVLALAPGLLNETLATVQASGVAGACSVAELADNFSAADAAQLENIVIYGDTVGAYEAKAVLAEGGVDLEATVLHIAPAGEADAAVAVMREVCSANLPCHPVCFTLRPPVRPTLPFLGLCMVKAPKTVQDVFAKH